ncbi:MAG: 30S ribosomal protein THX [Bacteroidota bacterium]
MGRGDKRTAKGKRFKGSYGISRPHKAAKSVAAKTAAPAAAKKTAAPAAAKKTAAPAAAKKVAAPKKAAAKKKAE